MMNLLKNALLTVALSSVTASMSCDEDRPLPGPLDPSSNNSAKLLLNESFDREMTFLKAELLLSKGRRMVLQDSISARWKIPTDRGETWYQWLDLVPYIDGKTAKKLADRDLEIHTRLHALQTTHCERLAREGAVLAKRRGLDEAASLKVRGSEAPSDDKR